MLVGSSPTVATTLNKNMATKNDITGDTIQSRANSKEYTDNYERAFAKKVWRYWAAYEGYDADKIMFNSTGLNQDDLITFKEFSERLLSNGK